MIKDLSGPPNNWSLETIEHNVFKAYAVDTINGTEMDPKSIMMYWFPNSWTLDDFSVSQNTVLSEQDQQFVGKVYPVKNDTSALLKRVFKSKKELGKLKRLYESNLVALGKEMNLPVDEKLRKKDNYKIIEDYIFN